MLSKFDRKNRGVSATGISALLLAAFAGTNVAFAQTQAPATPANPSAPAAQPEVTSANTAPAEVKVGDDLVVDLHVTDEDLGNVLEMLSIQSQRNIVATKNVSARVTANLYSVTFKEALDAILHVNGFKYQEVGNFIYVYTKEEFDAMEQASRQRQAQVFQLNYINAVDASEFVKPLLSESGQIKANGATETFALGETPSSHDKFASMATMVVVDFEENIKAIQDMLNAIDTKPMSVLVEATILQAAVNENNAFGVDFALMGGGNFADFVEAGGPLNVVNALIGGNNGQPEIPFPLDGRASGASSTPGNTSAPGTFKVGLVQDGVGVFLRMLDEVTDTTILSKPKILALNRMPSRILVGRKVGYISTTATDTATTQTVQFLDTGTQLYFRPFVTNKGDVRMELKPQVSEAQIREVTVSSNQTITIPDEVTNELVTNVIVPDGQTVVLGGLFRESTVTTRRQVPVLGDVPILGLAFRGHEDVVQRNEIIFLVTPTIVNDKITAAHGASGSRFVDRAAVGARNGLLSFSRERLTGQYNIEAERLFAKGDADSALWKLRVSLWMNPNQADAMALRERITGVKRFQNPTRSMLEQIIHKEKGLFIEANATPRELTSRGSTNTQGNQAQVEVSSNQTRNNSTKTATSAKNTQGGMFNGINGKGKSVKNDQSTFSDGSVQPMDPK
jgi:type IV pilus assembly protein PilQ